MANKTLSKFQTGFTLAEHLIVIAILAILAAAVIVVLNFRELLAQARDSRRVGELHSLTQTMGLYESSRVGYYQGTANIIYISLPDSSATCANLLANLPTIPAEWSYRCSTEENFRRSDGAGWLPHDFSIMFGGSPFDQLPIDPVNNTTHYYAYIYSYIDDAASWVLTAPLESSRHLQTSARRDGGTDPARIEIGTNLDLWAWISANNRLVGYWPLDGHFNDVSGNNNHGLQSGGVTFVTGKQGQAGNFDGVDDVVNVSHSTSLNIANEITLGVWVRANTVPPSFSDALVRKGALYWFEWRHTQSLEFSLFIAGVYQPLSAGLIDLRTNWHHVVGTYDGTIMRIYVNGTERGTRSVSGPIDRASFAFQINSSATVFNSPFHGLIDEVRIYNQALSAAEIQAIYNATR